MKTQYIVAVVIILALTVALIWKFSDSTQGPEPAPVPVQNDGMPDLSEYEGVVSTTTDGIFLYTNQRVGIDFSFPEGWHFGDDSLGRGSLQLFNYDQTNESGKGFREGMNKIEAIITDKGSSSPEPDYPEKSRKSTTVQVGGRTATREDIELEGWGAYRAYYIPLQNEQGKFIQIIIYGDPDNFHVLDELVKSIEWVQ